MMSFGEKVVEASPALNNTNAETVKSEVNQTNIENMGKKENSNSIKSTGYFKDISYYSGDTQILKQIFVPTK
jgi:hypothetical protein